jgi:signal transduction histidine kinase/DNA-binding response OmpR family regulator
MEIPMERILLIENDPQVIDLIAHQTLRPIGYQVDVIDSAGTAIKEIETNAPDLIITNLSLPGISGKDLLVALKSQGINIPMIVIIPKGHESDALQAFRLGALNFLSYPLREAEVVTVVDDTLGLYRRRLEANGNLFQVEEVEQRLDRHIQDLMEIFSIGKIVPSALNQQTLYNKITSTAVRVCQATSSWLLVFDLTRKKYILRATLNPDEDWQAKLNLPLEDNLSSVVIVSGQAVSAFGEAVKRFDLAGTVEAVLAVPIKWKDEVVGLLVVARKTPDPFTLDQQAMLEMLADYTSSLIENTRCYQILEQRLFYLQQSTLFTKIDSDIKNDILRQAGLELRSPLKSLTENLETLSNQGDRHLSHKQADAIKAIQEEADILMDIADSMIRIQQKDSSKLLEEADLNVLVNDVVKRYQAISQVCRIAIRTELPAVPTIVAVFPSQITKVLEGLLSNALKHSPAKGQITIRLEQKDNYTALYVKDHGEGINNNLSERIFDRKSSLFGEEARRFGGIGISLPMIKEIITAHRGEIWIVSERGKGFSIIFTLPR